MSEPLTDGFPVKSRGTISDRVFETLQEFKTVNFDSPTEAGCLNFIIKIIYF